MIKETLDILDLYNSINVGTNFSWRGMSAGETAHLYFIANIWKKIQDEIPILENNKYIQEEIISNDTPFGDIVKTKTNERDFNTILLLIDEGELFLHPNWQKEFINRLVKEIPVLFAPYDVQIILTTHSPFILSDLPKENVIFLKNKDGKCEVQNGSIDIKQTFGANIHTLLSDSFFMDGLAGKFSSDKINEVIKYLNGETVEGMNDEKAEKIINMIGEPIIKRYLTQQLNLKKQNITFDKVKELENRIAELEKNQKDDKNQP